jgi:hypothetical protein
VSSESAGTMPQRTKDGWKTNAQIKRQEKAWKRARASLMTKLGEEAIKSVAQTRERSAEIFKEMDADGNGSIDATELKGAFARAGVELTSKEVSAMMTEADEDGDGLIDAVDFENLLVEEVKRWKAINSSFCVVS